MENKISNVLELRIDNLVLNRHNEVHRFGFMDFMNYRHPQMAGYYGFCGIPLTEEWLLKFGLEELRLGYYKLTDEVTISVEGNVYTEGDYGINDWFMDCYTVHGLMNLYHSLTGQELTIK